MFVFKAAVVGAGTMGGQIAQTIAVAGIPVVLKDIDGQLVQARQVELPRIVTHAAAAKVTARSRRNSVVVAALVGLLLGIIAALVWDAYAARTRR